MSRPSSPASDAPSPVAHNVEHDEQPPREDVSESAQGVSTPSRENSQEASGDDTSGSPSRATSTSPSAVGPSSTSNTPAAGTSGPTSTSSSAPSAVAGTWQAVWSPAHNAYYFYNSVTQETTWVNPFQQPSAEAGPSSVASVPSGSAPPTSPGASSPTPDIYAAAVAQGIDPALAHLDPSLVAGGTGPGAFTYTAKFNARTGAFAKPDARDPTHLSEYERAKRMSEFYFDVNAWEREVEMRKLQEAQEEESKKRKRPTKKDIERFKEKKKQKKLAKTAWLRT